MRLHQVKVYLQDEIPRFGCGWRSLTIVAKGRKWVRLLHPPSKRRARIRASVWDQIARCQR